MAVEYEHLPNSDLVSLTCPTIHFLRPQDARVTKSKDEAPLDRQRMIGFEVLFFLIENYIYFM